MGNFIETECLSEVAEFKHSKGESLMLNNWTADSEDQRTDGLVDQIRFEDYKKRDQYVFSVYRGNRNWKRLEPRKGGKAPVWVERLPNGQNRSANEEDKSWLNHVWENPEDYQRVERFPREGDPFSVPLALLSREEVPRFDPGQVAKTRWLIDSFLAERSIQLVFGERGSFKTTLLLFAARAVARGEDFLGMKTRGRWVLYLDYENPANVLKARNDDLCLNLPDNPNLAIWDRFGRYPVPRPSDVALERLVHSCVQETGHGPWIIFDSWSSLLRPGDNGLNTGEIAPIYAQLRRLVDLGATITVLDHSRKYDAHTIYGGQDKEAKVDTIHNLETFENRLRPENTIVRVDSWLKRFAPRGAATFAFEVLSKKDDKGKWHVTGFRLAKDPVEELKREKIKFLCDLIDQNPDLGQEALARLAATKGLARDQAIELLKSGMGKYWDVQKSAHGKYCYKVRSKR